jgi:hypothetical protein
MIVEVCMLAAEGRFKDAKDDHALRQRIFGLAERCRGSSNAGLAAVGYFLASLADGNRVSAK